MRGGARPNSGRKKGFGTTVIRVPDFLVPRLKRTIAEYREDPEVFESSWRAMDELYSNSGSVEFVKRSISRNHKKRVSKRKK